MADLGDVMNVLASMVSGALYPNGAPGSPTGVGTLFDGLPVGASGTSIAGPLTSIYPGWPNPQQLDKDLKLGIVHVNVYPWKQDRNTTRYMEVWQITTPPAPSISASVAGNVVTLEGVPSPQQNIAVLVNRSAFTYQTVQSDTLSSVAASLAAIIGRAIPGATAIGANIFLPGTARIAAARVGTFGTGTKGIRNQERIFQVGIWAGAPSLRDAVAQVVDPAISSVRFLNLPDGFAARIIYHGSLLNDSEQKMGIYRRELLYSVDYATTVSEQEWQITVIQENVTPNIYGQGDTPVFTQYE